MFQFHVDVSVGFKSDQCTYQESRGQADVEVVLTGETALEVIVSVIRGMF